jgi:periplasmic divalent cation tolerance protein
MTSARVVLITASSGREARAIAQAVVREKLAACVNIVPGVRSLYWWKGKIESASEHLMVLKTQKTKVPALIRRVRALHSYTVPEVLALPVAKGHGPYLRWVVDSLK